MSVRPYGTTRLPLDEFSWNLITEDFSKLYRENPSFITILQERWALYTKPNKNFSSYLAHFFSEWETFQTKAAEKTKTHILCSVTPPLQIVPFMRKRGTILQSEAGYRWQYGACALHAGYLRLQIHTHRLCNTHCFYNATTVTRTRLIVTLYGTACLVLLLEPNETLCTGGFDIKNAFFVPTLHLRIPYDSRVKQRTCPYRQWPNVLSNRNTYVLCEV
jgi:hypothetical protein